MTPQTQPWVGTIVAGYDVPVVNERAARAAAGILFLGGIVAYGLAIVAESSEPLKPFGAFFIVDMLLRLTAGDRWSPTLALGRLIVIRQKPEWVGARQKEFAWWLGFGLALIACLTTGFLAAPLWITLALCGLCLTLLFLETAFGFCVGCTLHTIFVSAPPQYCPGDSCSTDETATHTSSPSTAVITAH